MTFAIATLFWSLIWNMLQYIFPNISQQWFYWFAKIIYTYQNYLNNVEKHMGSSIKNFIPIIYFKIK